MFSEFKNSIDCRGFSDLTPELTRPVLEGVARFCEDVWQPLNRIGDEEGCRRRMVLFVLRQALRRRIFTASSWNKLSAPEELGGAGLPGLIGIAAGEISVGSNAALALLWFDKCGIGDASRHGFAWMIEHVMQSL